MGRQNPVDNSRCPKPSDSWDGQPTTTLFSNVILSATKNLLGSSKEILRGAQDDIPQSGMLCIGRPLAEGRKHMMRWIPVSVIALSFMVSCPAPLSAQSPQKFCNHVLRELGLFWSDGYHARNGCCNSCVPDPRACGHQPGYVTVPAESGYPFAPTVAPPVPPTFAPPASATFAPPVAPTPAPPASNQPAPAPIPQANVQTWGVPAPGPSFSPVSGVRFSPSLPVYSQTSAWSAAFGQRPLPDPSHPEFIPASASW
jgi:hypothetical protein